MCVCVCVRVTLLNGSSRACHLFSVALPAQMEYFAVLVDVTHTDILHGTASIMATPELTTRYRLQLRPICVRVTLASPLQLLLICLRVRIKTSYYSMEAKMSSGAV